MVDSLAGKRTISPGRGVGRETGSALAPSLVLAGRLGVFQNDRLIREPPEINRGHMSLTSYRSHTRGDPAKNKHAPCQSWSGGYIPMKSIHCSCPPPQPY